MIQRSEELRLTLEAGETLDVRGEGIGQDLERDVAIELRVPRAIHLPHSARSQQRTHFIRAESNARSERHASLRRYAALQFLCPVEHNPDFGRGPLAGSQVSGCFAHQSDEPPVGHDVEGSRQRRGSPSNNGAREVLWAGEFQAWPSTDANGDEIAAGCAGRRRDIQQLLALLRPHRVKVTTDSWSLADGAGRKGLDEDTDVRREGIGTKGKRMVREPATVRRETRPDWLA